jgi:hypothetical protein
MQRKHAASLLCLAALAVALLVRAPVLQVGLVDDDYIQRAMLEHAFVIERGPLDLYWFGGRDAQEMRALMASGYLPWWTHPEHRVAMLRPFASALLALEHSLEARASTQHFIALALLALTAFCVRRLLASILPLGVASLGCVLFALDEAHASPTGWLANRATLISLLLGALALGSYIHARGAGASRGDRARSGLLLAIAFVSGEYGFFVLGYIAAFELVERRPGARAALLTAFGLAALTALLAAALGYGAFHSGFYVSPLQDPLRFAKVAAVRVPGLLFDLVLGLPSNYIDSGVPLREALLAQGVLDPVQWHRLPSYRVVAFFTAPLVLAGLFLVVRALVRRRAELAPLRYLVLGALLALAPAAGATPSPRLVGGAAIGFAALLAALIATLFDTLRAANAARPARAFVRNVPQAAALLALIALHVLLPAERAYAAALGIGARARAAEHWALRAEIPAELPSDAQVWLTSASDFTTAAHIAWVRREHGLPRPIVRWLSGASRPHDLARIDDRTLEVRVLSTDPGQAFTGSLYRPDDAPLARGDRVELPSFAVEVLDTYRGDARRFRVRADRSLDDPSIVLICPDPKGLVRCPMPPTGSTLRLPRAPLPWSGPNPAFSRSLRKW